MKTLRLLFVLFAFNTTNALAQWEMGLDMGAIVPVGTLAESSFPPGIGGDLVFMSPTILNPESDLKVQFGLNLGAGDNGRKSFKTNSQFEEGSLGFYNCIVTHQVSTRLTYRPHPHFGMFTEALAGLTRVHSGINETTNTKKVTGSSHTKVYSMRSFRYGGGIGASYYFNNYTRLELRADYTIGGPVKFIDMASADITEDGAIYTGVYSKRSDLVNIQLRICWSLIPNK